MFIIFRCPSPYLTLSGLVQRTRGLKEISKGTLWKRLRIQIAANMKRTYPKLQSIKQQIKPVKPNLSPYLTLRIRPTEAAFHLSLSSMFYFLLYFTSHYPPNWEGTKLHKRYAIKHKGQGKCCLSVNKPPIGQKPVRHELFTGLYCATSVT